MRTLALIAGVILLCGQVYAQTNSISSGNWSDGSTWSTGTVPGANTNVNVVNPLILDQNITIGTGDYIIYQSVTDISGGSAATLTATTSGGVLDIQAGTTTFEGNASFSNFFLTIRNGATLILGATTLNNGNTINIEAGGTLIINGNLTNSNSGGTFTLNGVVYVNGDYTTNNGNIDVGGSGDIITTGTIFNQGSSDVFGSNQDCNTGPCSGRNLCSYSNTISTGNQTLCSGSTPAVINANAVSSSPTYIWEASTTSATSGFNTAPGTSNLEDYTPSALTQTTWIRRKVIQGGCTGITPAVQISIVPSSGGWKGTTTDWNTNTNWCNNTVPTSATDVAISTGVPNMPQITATSFCNNLTIGSGASVTINGSNSFSIFGNLVNNGSLTTNTSTVTMAGATQQTLSGSAINFNNLTINNTASSSPQVTVNGFVNVLGTLTMTTGDLNLSGYNLTLGSNAGSTGTLTYTAGRIINGDFTRWMSTTVIPDGNNRGLFPMGSSSYNRPLYVSYPATAPNPGGRIKVSHTPATTVSVVNVVDGASTIQLRQDSYWTISTNGLSGGTFNLRAGGTGFGTIQEVSDLRLMLASSVVATAGTNSGTISDPRVNRTGLSLTNLANSFYIGSVDPANTTLPIELLSFTAKNIHTGVQLDWTTASEKDFDFFSIEHAVDGINFRELAQQNGKGGLKQRADYDFLHETPALGKNYYRLKSVDLDGSFEYSKLVMVTYQGGKHLAVFPNPAAPTHTQYQSNFEITEMDRISIVNQLGMQVAYGIPDTAEQVIRFSESLDPGVYLLQYVGADFKTVIRLVVK